MGSPDTPSPGLGQRHLEVTAVSATDREKLACARGGRRLVLATGALLALDLVGGLLSVANGLNTVSGAWGPTATLAAPVPMMAGQALLAAAAARWPDRRGAAAAGLLAAVSVVSGISGFLDGQFAKQGLSAPMIGFQCLLVAATLTVSGLAVARLLQITRPSAMWSTSRPADGRAESLR